METILFENNDSVKKKHMKKKIALGMGINFRKKQFN